MHIEFCFIKHSIKWQNLPNVNDFFASEKNDKLEFMEVKIMFAIIGASCFSTIIVLSILIICGLPLGEFTMGGKYRVFPKKLRIMLITQLILQILFVVVILQMGNLIPLWFSTTITRIIGIVMSVYLSLNVIMNFVSKSKKEKYVMTPLSLITAICFWITAFQM